ncbi:MAG: tetratricopeptide repeat protein [Planctomycetota bacterium]
MPATLIRRTWSHAAMLLALLVSFVPQVATAQSTPAPPGGTLSSVPQKKEFGAKELVGDAVSFSNRDYPNVDKAIQRFRNGDIQGAREFLEIARSETKRLPPVDLILAKMQIAARNVKAAMISLERVVTEEPSDPEAYLIMANQAFGQGRTTEASALFEYAAPIVEGFTSNNKRRSRFDVQLLAGRSAVLERREKWDQALELLLKWKEIDPDNAAALQRLAVTYFRLGKAKESFNHFKMAREISDRAPYPYVALGNLFTQDGDIEKARKAYERAYEETGGERSTSQAYAGWLIQQRELDKANEIATALLAQDESAVEALLLSGLIAQMRGDSERAEELLNKVLAVSPGNESATNWLALLLAARDDTTSQQKALRHAQLNARGYPNNAQANITLAWVLFKLGRTQESRAALQKGAQSGSLTPDSSYFVARMLAEQNSKPNARQILEQVVGKTANLFVYREQAEKLLEELKSE